MRQIHHALFLPAVNVNMTCQDLACASLQHQNHFTIDLQVVEIFHPAAAWFAHHAWQLLGAASNTQALHCYANPVHLHRPLQQASIASTLTCHKPTPTFSHVGTAPSAAPGHEPG